jgi:hypothetical protein
MTTPYRMSDERQRVTDPEGASLRMRDAEPMEDLTLKDAEEEEFEVLWAGDPGNQGA